MDRAQKKASVVLVSTAKKRVDEKGQTTIYAKVHRSKGSALFNVYV